MKFHELLKFEVENPGVWEIGLYEYPLWYTIRSRLLSEQVPTPSRFSVGMFKNFIADVKPNAVDTLVTVLNRPDLLSICNSLHQQHSCINIIRLEGSARISFTYQSALSWDILRLVCQKVAWIFLFKAFFKLKKEISSYCFGSDFDIYIRKYIGDIVYLRLVDYCFCGFKRIYYTNGIIPDIAKFDRSEKYIEIQHGHISNHHPGYVGVPRINGTLLCWNESTVQRLKKIGYSGRTSDFKIQPKKQCGSIEPYVIFATVDSEQFIRRFRNDIENSEFYIKLHPKMLDPNISNCSHKSVDYSAIRNAIVLGASTILHHIADENTLEELILVPFFDRERSMSKADYLALVLDEFPALRAQSKKIKVKRTDEF